MRIGSGLFLIGVLTATQLPQLPSPYISAILPVLVLLSVKYGGARYLLWYFSGLIWLCLVSYNTLSKKLDHELENEEITVLGYVASLPSLDSFYLQFEFSVIQITDGHGQTRTGPDKIRLNWYRPYPLVVPGEKLRLIVKLKSPHGYINPGGFDYEAWLFQQRILATGYVRKNITDSGQHDSQFSIHTLRYFLRDKLANILDDSAVSGLIPALIIGDRSNMNRDQWQVLSATGTSHLLAISGLHIGLIAGFAFFLMRWVWSLWYQGACLLPAQKVASCVSVVAALFYAMLAGFTIPTQRALIMITVAILFGFMSRRLSASYIYAIALLSVLLIDPLAVLSGGFWLSFAAVFLILVAMNNRLENVGRLNSIRQWGRLQIYIYAGLIPFLIIWFNQFPLLSLIANSVAIPWVTLICIPIIMSGIPVLLLNEAAGMFILSMGNEGLKALWFFLQYLASIEIAQIAMPQPSWLALLLASAGLGLFFVPTALPGRWLAVIYLLPLFLAQNKIMNNGEFEVIVLDVGQGLASVVKTRDHLLLYDTGPGFSTGFNTGWSVIIPYLKYSGFRRLDMIVLSHGDSDHIGGLADVMAAVEFNKLLTSVPDKIGSSRAEQCLAGQKWEWDDVHFEILSPYNDYNLSGNNASCVLKISNDQHAVLFTGDIESRAEIRLIEQYRDILDVDVLVAPHHGSATSSSPALIRATSPDHVIFPTGYLNRFKFPRQEVIERYENHGTKILNTAHDGAISIQFGINATSIVKQREKSLRYWHNNTLK